MALKQKRIEALKMRFYSEKTGLYIGAILGYTDQYGSTEYRATVTHGGNVYGRDCKTYTEAKEFIKNKKNELNIE